MADRTGALPGNFGDNTNGIATSGEGSNPRLLIRRGGGEWTAKNFPENISARNHICSMSSFMVEGHPNSSPRFTSRM